MAFRVWGSGFGAVAFVFGMGWEGGGFGTENP